jgi:hypothetical protein
LDAVHDREFEKWLRSAAMHPANRITFWQKLFGAKSSRAAFNKSEAERLADDIAKEIQTLKEQLHSADDVCYQQQGWSIMMS